MQGRASARCRTYRAPIVVVDDDHQVLDVIQRLLVRQQYPCELLSGGVEAIEYLEHHADHVPCMVLDLVMPDTDGDAVLLWMRSHASEIPVVVMTGYSRKGLDEYLDHPNVVGILEKPFSRKQLLLQIKRACESGRNSRLELS